MYEDNITILRENPQAIGNILNTKYAPVKRFPVMVRLPW